MKLTRVPETNSFGLVLPPTTEDLEYLRLFQKPKDRPDTVDRHHLYWPKKLYHSTKLSQEFSEHSFNSIWILISDHRAIHHQFDGVPMPKREVMATFLEEANLLEGLGISMRAIDMIDTALYEDRVVDHQATEENRQRNVEIINNTVMRVPKFEAIPAQLANLAVKQLYELSLAA
ncbi:MAG: hypothetical protein WDN66_02220 [Candidatus Saccharibacteria bacterium]